MRQLEEVLPWQEGVLPRQEEEEEQALAAPTFFAFLASLR